ncbi:hypothetical protein Patl1_26680 [Pistacia atlantica]|uniref:Uncharacterized protein n=1 Tax=Pistacia atlantica TaxID=434234 RepID=A0ACC1B3A8_9ROSI|nr:hypothetical protein Patl1_26680 [Pistacia atlantica]
MLCFWGRSELKAMIQWLAASQALRPFMSYYTFGVEALQNLGQVFIFLLLQFLHHLSFLHHHLANVSKIFAASDEIRLTLEEYR